MSGPTPATPVALDPDQTASFQYVLHATGEGPLRHLVTVQGAATAGAPVVSNEASLDVEISGLVVTVRFLTAEGEVTEAASGRRRLLNEVGDWITAQRIAQDTLASVLGTRVPYARPVASEHAPLTAPQATSEVRAED